VIQQLLISFIKHVTFKDKFNKKQLIAVQCAACYSMQPWNYEM